MITEGAEKYLVGASIYTKNAVLEVKNIPCECDNRVLCWRCELLDKIKNTKEIIDGEISKRFL